MAKRISEASFAAEHAGSFGIGNSLQKHLDAMLIGILFPSIVGIHFGNCLVYAFQKVVEIS